MSSVWRLWMRFLSGSFTWALVLLRFVNTAQIRDFHNFISRAQMIAFFGCLMQLLINRRWRRKWWWYAGFMNGQLFPIFSTHFSFSSPTWLQWKMKKVFSFKWLKHRPQIDAASIIPWRNSNISKATIFKTQVACFLQYPRTWLNCSWNRSRCVFAVRLVTWAWPLLGPARSDAVSALFSCSLEAARPRDG